MTIDSVDNKKIKNIRKLNQKKYRDETNEFLVEGIHLVREAYKEGLLKEVILEENEEIDFKVDTTYVTYNVIKSISSLDTPYKTIGVCKKKEEKEINGTLHLDVDVTVCAIEDTFVQHGSVEELRRMLKLDADSLYDRIKHIISTDCTE